MKIPYRYILLGIVAQVIVGVTLDMCGVNKYYVGSFSMVAYFTIALYPIYKN